MNESCHIRVSKFTEFLHRGTDMQGDNFISNDVQEKVHTIQDSVRRIQEEEKILSRRQDDFKSRKRTLSITIKEIQSHCCICEGAHMNSDRIAHEPSQRSTCQRLHEKKITCMYLRKALKDAEFQISESEQKLQEMRGTHGIFCQELNRALDHGFRILDALNSNDDNEAS